MFSNEAQRYAVVKALLTNVGAEDLFDDASGEFMEPIRGYSSAETFIIDLARGLITWDHPVVLWRGLAKLDLAMRAMVFDLFTSIHSGQQFIDDWTRAYATRR